MLSSMSQFKEIYMNDRFRNNNQYNSNDRTEESSMIVEAVDKSYLEVSYDPILTTVVPCLANISGQNRENFCPSSRSAKRRR